MSNVIHVSHKDFQSEVRQSRIPVVVDFYASWCPPCRALAPIIDRLAKEFAGQVKFVKINSNEEQQLAREFQVTGLPTLVFIEDGQIAGQVAGLPQEVALRAQIRNWVNSKKVANL